MPLLHTNSCYRGSHHEQKNLPTHQVGQIKLFEGVFHIHMQRIKAFFGH